MAGRGAAGDMIRTGGIKRQSHMIDMSVCLSVRLLLSFTKTVAKLTI